MRTQKSLTTNVSVLKTYSYLYALGLIAIAKYPRRYLQTCISIFCFLTTWQSYNRPIKSQLLSATIETLTQNALATIEIQTLTNQITPTSRLLSTRLYLTAEMLQDFRSFFRLRLVTRRLKGAYTLILSSLF